MGRFLIIDTEVEMNSAVRQWLNSMLTYKAVLSPEETEEVFKKVWDEAVDSSADNIENGLVCSDRTDIEFNELKKTL